MPPQELAASSPTLRAPPDAESAIWKRHGWRVRRSQHTRGVRTVDGSDFPSVGAKTGRVGREPYSLPTIPVAGGDGRELGRDGPAHGLFHTSAITLPEIHRSGRWPSRRRRQPSMESSMRLRSPPLSPQAMLPSCGSPPLRELQQRSSVECVEFTFDSLNLRRTGLHENQLSSSLTELSSQLARNGPSEVEGCATANNQLGRFKGVGALAEALVNQCGSLERAFTSFDYNHQGKLSRSQWETGLLLLKLDCEALCGISSKKLFKMMDGKHKREVTLDAWTSFFQQLEGTLAADLLTEDFGPIRRRSADPRRSPSPSKLFMDGTPLEDECHDHVDQRNCTKGKKNSWFAGSRTGDHVQRKSSFDDAAARLRCLVVKDVEASREHAPDDAHSPVGRDKPTTRFTGCSEQTRQECNETGSNNQTPGKISGARNARVVQNRTSETGGNQRRSIRRPLLDDVAIEASEAVPARSSFSPKFQEVLKVGSELADLRSLNDDELDAIAEQEQLEEELQELDLSGIKALAYVLTAKLRSLRQAFKWFDTTRSGHIAQVSFSTGLALLHIDMEKLTGMTASRVFGLMQGEKPDGTVARSKWDSFFDAVSSGDLQALLKKAKGDGSASGSLAERAKAKKEKLRLLRAEQVSKAEPSASRRVEETTAIQRTAKKRKSKLQMGVSADAFASKPAVAQNVAEDGHMDDSDMQQHVQGELATSTEHEQQQIDEQLGKAPQQSKVIHRRVRLESWSDPEDRQSQPSDDELAFDSEAPDIMLEAEEVQDEKEEEEEQEEEESFRSRVRRELAALSFGESMEYVTELGTWQSSIIEEVAQELHLWIHTSEDHRAPLGPGLSARSSSSQDTGMLAGAVVLVHNSLDFANEIREQLLGIEAFDNLEFPTSFTEAQRRLVHILAAQLGLCTHSEGQGSQRRVVAYNMGDLVAEIRRDLSALQHGESKAYPQSFTLAQQRLVHVIAAELGLWVHMPRSSESCWMEVYNHGDFAERVRVDLEQLMAGEQHEFSSELSELQRKIVMYIATELGLTSGYQGEGATRCIVVASLGDFLSDVRRDLCKLEPGEKLAFEPGLTVLQRRVVHELAAELMLHSESHDDGAGRCVVVTRPGSSGEGVNVDTGTEAMAVAEPTPWSDADLQQEWHHAGSSADDDDETGSQAEAEETEASVISRLFYVYATGTYNGERIFLRFPDLRHFAEDASDAMPENYRRFQRFASDLESVFDDTLQLQIDMGTRTRKGLTCHWFQVFIQKAMRSIGRSVVGFLLALVASRN